MPIYPKDLSVLIPFYNEAGNILPLLEEVEQALVDIDYEVICVNDCSSDTTAIELDQARDRWPEQVKIYSHIHRAGKSAALMTGLRAAQGEWIQLLDGDGQNDPADTARLWQDIILIPADKQLGIITGKRSSRNDSGFKWLQSRIANGIRRFLLGDQATDTGCGFKLIRRRAFEDLPYFSAMHRFLPALIMRAGWQVVEANVADRPRLSGQSKYGFLDRLGAGMVDLLGVIWLMNRGQYGIAREWNDPRDNTE